MTYKPGTMTQMATANNISYVEVRIYQTLKVVADAYRARGLDVTLGDERSETDTP